MTPILAVPDFTKIFILEYHSLGMSLGVVLMEQGKSHAFTSHHLCDHNLGESTYEKEMMAILHTIEAWHPYLIGWQS